MYQMFTTVVILHQILRQAGSDPTIAFRDFLLRIRNGDNKDDWEMLLKRSSQADNANDFTEAIRLL